MSHYEMIVHWKTLVPGDVVRKWNDKTHTLVVTDVSRNPGVVVLRDNRTSHTEVLTFERGTRYTKLIRVRRNSLEEVA